MPLSPLDIHKSEPTPDELAEEIRGLRADLQKFTESVEGLNRGLGEVGFLLKTVLNLAADPSRLVEEIIRRNRGG